MRKDIVAYRELFGRTRCAARENVDGGKRVGRRWLRAGRIHGGLRAMVAQRNHAHCMPLNHVHHFGCQILLHHHDDRRTELFYGGGHGGRRLECVDHSDRSRLRQQTNETGKRGRMIARDEAYGRSADVCELGVHLPRDLLHPSPSVPVTFELDCGDSGIEVQQLAAQLSEFHGYITLCCCIDGKRRHHVRRFIIGNARCRFFAHETP